MALGKTSLDSDERSPRGAWFDGDSFMQSKESLSTGDLKSDDDVFPRKASETEIQDLPREADRIPIAAWLLIFTGAASRLAWFGNTVPWQNYIQNARGSDPLPGALGLGQATATTIQGGFLVFQYLTPLPFALISDAWVGRYGTLLISLGLLVTGYAILVATSLPIALDHGAGLGGLITTMVFIGMGQGGVSAVMYPFIGDQIPDSCHMVTRNKKGKLVVLDRMLTIQSAFSTYYWFVNITSLSAIATTFMEKKLSFWVAYLVPTCILAVTVLPIVIWNQILVKLPPQGNVLPQAGKALFLACCSGFRISSADPIYQRMQHDRAVSWSSAFVIELERGVKACRVIIVFIIFWLCYNQTTTNLISQAGQMKLQGISNDTTQSLNPIACIILAPIIQNMVLPFLRRRKLTFGPIMRMSVAFLFVAAAFGYLAGLQQYIYSQGPCFDHPLNCPAARGPDGKIRPNNVSVWIQTPAHFILGVGEILALVSLNEYTYTQAPTNMKAVVQAFQQLMGSAGGALGIAMGPISRDPWLVIMYACLAGTMGLCAVLFWAYFRRYDDSYENEHNDG